MTPTGLMYPHPASEGVSGTSPVGKTFVFQSTVAAAPLMLSASTAYTLSFSVPKYSTFLLPAPGIATWFR